jgi:hypothetical protein
LLRGARGGTDTVAPFNAARDDEHTANREL